MALPLFLSLLACDGEPEPSPTLAAGTCDLPYKNTVQAAPWVRSSTAIRTYLYEADLDAGLAKIQLLGEHEAPLGTLLVWQNLDDSGDAPVGAMQASLGELTLTTTGAWGEEPRYTVDAILDDGVNRVESTATFVHQRCFNVSDAESGPPCADSLPLAEATISLASCGLIVDDLMRQGVAPVLRDFEYRVLAAANAPTLGGRVIRDQSTMYRLALRSGGKDLPSEDITSWVQQTGADAIIGTQDEQLLTTAFLDRTWWRAVEDHVGYCGTAPGLAGGTSHVITVRSGGSTTRQAMGGACVGEHDADAWDQGGGSRGGNNAWGDPHLTTLDGHAFDFQGGGEFILSRSTDGGDVHVQIRTEPHSHPPQAPDACADVTYVTAVAARVGAHRIAFYGSLVRLDGQLLATNVPLPELPGGTELTLDPGGRHTIRWPDGTELWVKGDGTMSLGLSLAPAHVGRVEGLLGNFDGRSDNDLQLANGVVLTQPTSFSDIHGPYADAWRTDSDTTLFDYEMGEDSSTFTMRGFPSGPVRLDDLPQAARDAARAACIEGDVEHEAALSACILDTVCAPGGGDGDPVGDALNQPLPQTWQGPGVFDVSTGGAVELKPLPASIDATPWAEPSNRCEPRERRHIALYREASISLTEDVALDLATPGAFDGAGIPETGFVIAGQEVQSWLLHRSPGTADEVGLSGTVRFAAPVLGVVLTSAGLDATDEQLGAAALYDGGAERGTELSTDRFELSEDRMELRIFFTGDDLDEARVLTEVTP